MKKIVLTDKQKECVKYPKEKNLLVRGIAGSGKSLVLVNRAAYLREEAAKMGKSPRIAIFTYVNSLVNYTREVVDTLGENVQDIVISTIDKQAWNCYRDMFGGGRITYNFDKKLLDSIVEDEARSTNNRFLKPDMRDFLIDEICWIKGRSISSSRDYEECVRVGRGAGKGSVRPSKEERRLIFRICSRYYSENPMMSADEMYEKILASSSRIPANYRFDFVMIDESQDLTLNKLRYARTITGKALTIAADQAQKIYTTGFTWKELGIDIRGQSSKKLTGTFRNTYEIALLADKMLAHNTEREAMKDEYVEPELPSRHGPKPQLIYEPSYGQENMDICQLIREELAEDSTRTIAILVMSWKERNDVTRMLDGRGIHYGILDNKNETKVLTPGVKVVTIHSSKGLEFDTVLIPFLDEGRFPPRDKNNSSDEREDVMNRTRNLLYVAMTRAKSTLYMYTLKGSESPLVAELDKNNMDIQQH